GRHTRWPRDWSSDVCSSDLLRLVAPAECGQSHVALAARPEPGTRRGDDVRLAEEPVEEVPRAEPPGRLDPDGRRVLPAIGPEPRRLEPLPDDPGVLHVEIDRRPDLAAPLVGVDGGGPALDDIGHAVELRRLAPEPERVEAHRLAGAVAAHEALGHDGERASRP